MRRTWLYTTNVLALLLILQSLGAAVHFARNTGVAYSSAPQWLVAAGGVWFAGMGWVLAWGRPGLQKLLVSLSALLFAVVWSILFVRLPGGVEGPGFSHGERSLLGPGWRVRMVASAGEDTSWSWKRWYEPMLVHRAFLVWCGDSARPDGARLKLTANDGTVLAQLPGTRMPAEDGPRCWRLVFATPAQDSQFPATLEFSLPESSAAVATVEISAGRLRKNVR